MLAWNGLANKAKLDGIDPTVTATIPAKNEMR